TQKRLEHDEKFPNEPRRIRADEQVAITDDEVQVSGRAGVMDVNERLFQMILQKNPGATFAVEESYPMHHTYAGATPLGPIMEIRAQDANAPIDDARVDQALQYWRETRDQLLSGAGAKDSGDSTLLTYARLAAAQGNLLAYSNRAADAEQAYRLGIEIDSGSPEAVYGLANILNHSGRGEEAKQIIAKAQQVNPDFQKYADPSSSWMVTHAKR
ncbi:MAG TPA: tetratricopeptide repeat protein, partial [Verrucomicrobiae bacterium]